MVKKKKTNYWIISTIILGIIVISQFIIYNISSPRVMMTGTSDDEVCIRWSEPKNDIGGGRSRYCLKTIPYNDEFNRACYWNYDCKVYSEWREEYLGVPPSCLYNNITDSYWGSSPTSREASLIEEREKSNALK